MGLRQWFCRHAHHRRERDLNGALMLVCDACGKSVPAITRDAQDALTLQLLKRRIAKSKRAIAKASKAQVVATEPANVTPMRRAK
jgi:hypothetical protein